MKSLFKSIAFVLLYVVLYFFASIITGAIFGVLLILVKLASGNFNPQIASNFQNEVSAYTSTLLLLTSIVAFLLIWVVFLVRKKNIFKICSFKKLDIKRIGLLAIGGIALNVFVGYTMSLALEHTGLNNYIDSLRQYTEPLMEGNYIITLLAVALVVPIFEEIFFRGVIFNELKRGMPISAAIVIQALLFAIFHGNLIQGIYTFVIGILFALANIWFRSIWASITLHIFFNSTSMMLDKISGDISDITCIIIAVMSLVVSTAVFYLLWKKRITANNTNEVITVDNNNFEA